MKTIYSGPLKWNMLDTQWTSIAGILAAAIVHFGPSLVDYLNSLGGTWAKVLAWVLFTLGFGFVRWARDNKPT